MFVLISFFDRLGKLKTGSSVCPKSTNLIFFVLDFRFRCPPSFLPPPPGIRMIRDWNMTRDKKASLS